MIPIAPWLLLPLLASATAALQFSSEPVLLAGQPVVVTWDGPGEAELDLLVTRVGGATQAWPPVRSGQGRVELAGFQPGSYQLAAELHRDGRPALRADQAVAILPELTLAATRLQHLLPHLRQALAKGEPGRLLTVAPAGSTGGGIGLAQMLAAGLATVLEGRLEGTETTYDAVDASLSGALDEAVAAHQPQVVVLVLGSLERLPWSVGVALAGGLAKVVADAGADLVLLTPPPLPGRGPGALARALEDGRGLTAALGDRHLVVDSAMALWPADAGYLGQLDLALRALVGQDGELLAAARYQLAVAGLEQLTDRGRPAPPVTLAARLDARYDDDSPAALELHNAGAETQHVRLVLFQPSDLTPPEGLAVTVPAGQTTTVRRNVHLPPAAQVAADAALRAVYGGAGGRLLGAAFCSPGGSFPLWAELAPQVFGLRVVPGAQVCTGSPSIRVEVTNAGQRPVSGVVRGAGVTPFRVSPQSCVEVRLPVPVPAEGQGRLPLTLEAAGDHLAAPAVATVRYAAAAVAKPLPVRLDGDLDEWREATWYEVGRPSQVVAGARSWTGPADAAARFAVATTAAGLALAVSRSDNVAAAGDGLELRWDPRPAAALTLPGRVRVLRLPATGEPTGNGADAVQMSPAGDAAVELLLPWPATGLDAWDGGRLLGFDLVVLDDDPQERPVVVGFAGELWSDLDPGRLGLLRLGDADGPPPVRLLVAPDDLPPLPATSVGPSATLP